MLMEYVDAPEITVDLFADKGEVVFHQTRTREEFLTGLAMAFKTIDRPELVELTRKVVRHLDLDYYQSVQWIGGRLLEINPRVSTFVYQEDFIIPYLGIKYTLGELDAGRRGGDPGARAHHAPLGALLRPGLLGRLSEGRAARAGPGPTTRRRAPRAHPVPDATTSPPRTTPPPRACTAWRREWARSGHRVTVLTCAPNVPAGVVYEGYENKLYQEEWIDGIRTVRVWTWLAANRGRVRRGLNYLSYLAAAGAAGPLLRPRADVVIATTPAVLRRLGGLAGRARPRRAVRARGPRHLARLHRRRRRARGGPHHPRARQARARALRRRRPHRRRRRRLPHEHDPQGRRPVQDLVVTNGVDVDLFEPREPDQELRARLGFSPETFVVTFAGTIGMASGLEVALGAARRLKEKGRDDIAFLLVGDGAVRAELEEQARARGPRPTWSSPASCRAPSCPPTSPSSDACLVHFRKQELFSTILPSKFFEDAAMERPILLGFEGDARAMLDEADCGIAFEPSNDEELAAAAERLAAATPRSGGGSARTAAATSSSTSTAAGSRTTTSRSSSACAPTTGAAAGERPGRLRRRAAPRPPPRLR